MSTCVLTRFSRLLIGGTLAAVTGLASITLTDKANAADLTWGGLYRVEGNFIENPELSGAKSNKAYLLHHLVLSPKIVAADGLTIFSRFDVLNDAGFGVGPTGRIYSVAGDVIGNGPGSGPGIATTGTESNAFATTQQASTVAVTSLYASWVHEFGQLVVGRTPFHFGLGAAYNAGNGLFDHYIDTKDVVGYRVILGNLSFFPMIGKVSEGNLGEEDDVNDYIIQLMYENPETELALGILYQRRIGTHAGNDAPINGDPTTGGPIGGPGATYADGFNQSLIGLFSTQKLGDFRIGVEADLISGDTGVSTAGVGTSLNGFGVAAELGWEPQDSKWSAQFKAGMASGDDPGTADTYEGFVFNRNYDVALLMFNHPLGQADFLRSGLVRNTGASAPPVRNQIDTEAISNAIYLAPSVQYQWKENMSYGGSFIYGILNKDPIAGSGTASDLGYEIDLNFTYKPYERLTWITQMGFLLPGDAWKGGSNNFDTDMAYGITTKAAISF